jgi:nucleotide-binding universal stress UspA family protein
MEKKIVIPIDGSVHAMEAVDYASRMTEVIPRLRFVLLHIQPPLSQYLTEEARKKTKARLELETLIRKNEAKAREILEKTAQRMIRKNVDAAHIEQVTRPRQTGVADDILALGLAQAYDAILVGRRGASYLREWLMGSVTANLVENAKVTPVWVVDGNVRNTEIILAADGSQTSLRALDHLAYILSGRPDRKIHVLHARPRFQDFCEITLEEETVKNAEAVFFKDDQRCMRDFLQQAESVLEKNGFGRNQIELQTIEGNLSIAQSLMKYSRDNNFGTLVLGKRGQSRSLFTGSVSRGLLNKTNRAALWVVP